MTREKWTEWVDLTQEERDEIRKQYPKLNHRYFDWRYLNSKWEYVDWEEVTDMIIYD